MSPIQSFNGIPNHSSPRRSVSVFIAALLRANREDARLVDSANTARPRRRIDRVDLTSVHAACCITTGASFDLVSQKHRRNGAA